MASARHRRRGPALRSEPQNIGPRRLGGRLGGGVSDAGRPGSWDWGELRNNPGPVQPVIPGMPPGGNPVQARGSPVSKEARRARNFALRGWFVPHHIWRDGHAAIDISDPERDGGGQRMAFGFVQRGYRYSMAIADLGVAQGHPIDHVLPACIGHRDGRDSADEIMPVTPSVSTQYKSLPASVPLRPHHRQR